MAKDIKVRFKGEDKGAISTTKKVKGELGDLDKTVKKSSASMLKAGAAIGIAVIALRIINRVMNDLQEAYYKQEAAVTKLEAALKATNNALGMSSTELQGFASELSRVTAIADEDIIATEALMVTFTKIGRDVFPTAIKAAADMSVMFGQDLQQSAIQLGTALNDPIAGVGRLLRIGISFTEEQKSMIASFMEMNDLAGAQGVILSELAAEFGGVAEAMGQTAQGAAIRLKNAFGDLKEQLGGLIAEGATPFRNVLTQVITALTDSIKQTREFKKAIQEIREANIAGVVAPEEALITVYSQKLVPLMERFDEIQLKIKIATDAGAEWKNIQEELVPLLEKLSPKIEFYQNRIKALTATIEERNAVERETARLAAEAAEFQLRLQSGLEFYNSALEKTLTADEKKRREYELVIKGLQDYINILPRTTAAEEAHFQEVAALRDLYRELGEEIGKVNEELERLPSLLPQAGTPPISGATGGGAQMLLGPWPTPMREEKEEEAEEVSAGIMAFDEALSAGAPQIAGFISMIGSFSTTLAMAAGPAFLLVLAVLAVIEIFKGMMEVLQPLIDNILQPLSAMLQIIGQVLGTLLAPAFEWLGRVVSKIADAFIWLYNKAIMPVGNLLYNVIATVVQTFTWMVERVRIAIHNFCEFIKHPFRKGKRDIWGKPSLKSWLDQYVTKDPLTEIIREDIYPTDETKDDTLADLGSTTTIQRQPDNYFYIYIQGPILGTSGIDEAAALIIEAIERHGALGGKIHIEEAIVPMAG